MVERAFHPGAEAVNLKFIALSLRESAPPLNYGLSSYMYLFIFLPFFNKKRMRRVKCEAFFFGIPVDCGEDSV